MRIVFMGSSDASALTLRALLKSSVFSVVGVVTQPDRPSGRHHRFTPCPCKAYAVSRKIPVILTPENVNAPEAMEQIRLLRPDVIVVVAFGQILRRALLELPPLGCVNGHFSLLPKHRGAAPVQAAILAGDRVTGVTIMQMDEHMDTGDILLTAVEPICSDDSYGDLMDRLAILGAVAMAKALRMMIAGTLRPKPQDHALATFSQKIRREDGLIDWSMPATDIWRRVRAYDPWPGAHTFLPAGRIRAGTAGRIKILECAPVPEEMIPGLAPAPGAAPGTLRAITPAGPVVQTGRGLLCLLTVQHEGARAMSGKEFLNGHPMRAGDRLSPRPAVEPPHEAAPSPAAR